MEYEEAPSGYIKLYHYKEPFIKFYDDITGLGYGFQGVIAFDGTSDKLQCHFCGEWFGALPHHIRSKHGMTAKEYKEKVGLRQTTALINEYTRDKMIANGRNRFKNITSNKGVKMSEETKAKIRATLEKNNPERDNELGTCPDQLVDRFHKLKEKLGYRPSYKECGFVTTAVKVYGSWDTFLKVCGETGKYKNQHGRGKAKELITKSKMKEFFKDFYIRFSTVPKIEEIKKSKGCDEYIFTQAYFGFSVAEVSNRMSKLSKEIEKETMCKSGDYKPCFHSNIPYTKKMLTDLLVSFKKRYGRNPSKSDIRRKLLPPKYAFRKDWTSFDKAVSEVLK